MSGGGDVFEWLFVSEKPERLLEFVVCTQCTLHMHGTIPSYHLCTVAVWCVDQYVAWKTRLECAGLNDIHSIGDSDREGRPFSKP